jgi:hypothetical protein
VKWGFLEVIFGGFYGSISGEFYRTIHGVVPCHGGWASPEMVTQSPEMVTHGWVTAKTNPTPISQNKTQTLNQRDPTKSTKNISSAAQTPSRPTQTTGVDLTERPAAALLPSCFFFGVFLLFSFSPTHLFFLFFG